MQQKVSFRLGPVGGFKIAPPKGDQPPAIAPILASRVFASGSRHEVNDTLGVELEVGFEILQDLPEDGFPARPEAFFRPRPVIELVDSRIAGPLAADPFVKLSDLGINHALILGTPINGWDGSDFDSVSASMACGDAVLLENDGSVPGGSAIAALRLLYDILGDHCGGIRAGQTLITGSLHPMTLLPAGTVLRGDIEGLGRVEAHLR
ncbi:hydratase [Aliiruegeria haliotis]|uniref:hydratase n=1 Tax=Aliiruegeria haliotis TaxID=1280846 RepID=UPI001FEB6E28|nr:hydratase [Aliiruegeria haliotis]